MRALLKYAKENKLGVFTLTLSLAYIFIGLPAQIYQIWETRAVQAIFPADVFTSGSSIIVLGGVWRSAQRLADDHC